MMSSSSFKPGLAARPAQSTFSTGPHSSQNHLLEKVNARTSTPDSEALASSDDEIDHKHSVIQPQKPARRSSWLNDTSAPLPRPRKGSFASGSMSPTASHPSTPSAETGAGSWGPHPTMSRAPGAPAFPWGTGIWNNDRKDPPSRLSEVQQVQPSPTSTVPSGTAANSFFGPDSGMQTLPSNREPASNSQIPFAIPLHPTPKTYRSQSYSVGQMEHESGSPAGLTSAALGRARHPGLQHRPSRPSMLCEMANDGSMLGKVKEVEDDDEESTIDLIQGVIHQTSEAKAIEMLTRENAILRQQQYNARIRPRASTSSGMSAYFGNGYALQDTVPEESEYAIDELDEINETGESFAKRAANRRMSEYGAAPLRSPFGMDSRKAENLKKALWSTSSLPLGGDGSQSRRHSFANMPTRQGSISSIADSTSILEAQTPDSQQLQDYVSGLTENPSYFTGGNTSSYMSQMSHLSANLPSAYHNLYPSPYGVQPSFANRAPSPHRGAYGMAQPRHNQLLHIVLFKCARADVFYIQEGTGLTVKPGDLVIVEADRGTDLGTVAKDNVDWQTAKDLKEHYAEEHYKWLMMYSQGAAAAQEGSGAGLLASSNGLQGSAVGGMGPPTQHHIQEPNSGELRPKLIKRLAQVHEVQSLRDKEGQEAKAKRVCMQKVKEHALNMEILDAEFQMDWKKLTFYYFADAYINFNSLVTDLFKIYKTRIWMSAINPASFASPTLGIQAPSGVGPGAVGVGRSSSSNERRQNPQQHEQQAPSFAARTQAARGYQSGFNQPFSGGGGAPPPQAYPSINYAYGQGGAFGNARAAAPYSQGLSPNADAFASAGLQHLGDFQSMRRLPQGVPSPNAHSQGISSLAQQNDWSTAFQGLSLNSH